MIAPLVSNGVQMLPLVVKQPEGIHRESVCEVLYVALRGAYKAEE